jgi:hypothetical protein
VTSRALVTARGMSLDFPFATKSLMTWISICGGANRILIYYKAPTTTYRGIFQVTNAANNQVLGYISKSTFSQAQYRYQPNESDAVIVTFQAPSGQTSLTGVEVTATVRVSDYLSLICCIQNLLPRIPI